MQSTKAYIGLGSNLGDRADFIDKAVSHLNNTDGIEVTSVSDIIETQPLGDGPGGDYLNAVTRIQTSLAAEKLHARMIAVEDALGRTRGRKWMPRTIDLDLLLYGDNIIETEHLKVPHREMHLRSFVLKGMCKLDADLHHPVLKQSMRQLAGRLNGENFICDGQRPQLVSVAGLIGAGKTTLAGGLAKEVGCEMLAEAYDENPYLADVYAGRSEFALDSQLYFLNSRVAQLKKDSLKPGRAVVTDYVFDKEMIYAARTLDEQQLVLYKERNTAAAPLVEKPVLVVYLQASAAECLERIHRRNRPYEQKIELKELESLAGDYEKLFAGWRTSPVIRLGPGDFNCLDKDEVKWLANQVSCYTSTG
ncbi:MAG TPA: 2-amino-4-hydroxy-6-hydroxymethyldihydropteridine diphosphokinase [Planctomycetes bacterium]|nr:2-amino-4-hydroxy-6-hydroxymethyldihydropteridine diphosphokinase [Planctomycetota bacterium]